MPSERKATALPANLLALLEHEERQARWSSLREASCEQLLDELARLMLQPADAEAGDEGGEADQGTAP